MKRDRLAIICVAMVAFVSTASSSTSSEKSAAQPGMTTVPVYFLDVDGKPLTPEAIPKDLTLQLGAIPGSLGGGVGTPLQAVRIGHNKKIRLDLADLSAKLVTRAAKFGEADATPLELTPQETGFARVSTTVSSSSGAPTGLAVLFWDLRANGSLSLLYCDRPCRLHASSARESTDDFDFDASSAGLAWMLSKKDRYSHFTHTRAVNALPAVVICPPEAVDKIAATLAR